MVENTVLLFTGTCTLGFTNCILWEFAYAMYYIVKVIPVIIVQNIGCYGVSYS